MDIYKEIILDHYHNPRHFGIPKDMPQGVTADNPSCGDTLTFSVTITNGKIERVSFEGSGCALSMAGASLLAEHIHDMGVSNVTGLTSSDMIALLGVEVGPARTKCALLPLETVQKALHNQ